MIKAISILLLMGLLIAGCGSTHQRRHKEEPRKEQIEQDGESQKEKDLDALDVLLSKPGSPAKEAVDIVINGQADMSFILNPASIEQVQRVSEDGLIMPRKSTYFYPKLISGQVMNVHR